MKNLILLKKRKQQKHLLFILIPFIFKLFYFLDLNKVFSQTPKTVGDILKDIAKEKNQKKKNKEFNIGNRYSSILNNVKTKFNNRSRGKKKTKIVALPKNLSLHYKSGDKADLEQLTNKSIKQLHRLSLRFKKSKKRGEIWLRLGKAYIEKAKLVELKIHEIHNKKLEKYNKGKRKNPPHLNLKPAHFYAKKAIDIYNLFIKQFPNDKKTDQALFYLGYNLFKVDQTKKGSSIYSRLIKRFPKSQYINGAHFYLGNYYFDQGKWNQSSFYYQKVISKKQKHRFYFFSLYKLSWSYYKSKKFKNALKQINKTMRICQSFSSRRRNTPLGSLARSLFYQAKKESPLFFASGGNYKMAEIYFKNIFSSSSEVEKIMVNLADQYRIDNQLKKAEYILFNIIRKSPLSQKSFDYHRQIISMYLSSGLNEEQMRNKIRFWIKNYKPKSKWYSFHHKKNEKLANQSYTIMEESFRIFILNTHKTSYINKRKENFYNIKKDYEYYFFVFKKSSHLDNMHFFFAELLFDIKQYKKAAFHYEWIKKNKPKSQHYKVASFNFVISLEKTLPSLKEIEKTHKKTQREDTTKKINLSIQKFKQAASEYVKEFPKDKNIIKIKYKLALLDYYQGHIDEAFKKFHVIIKNHTEVQYAAHLSQLMLETFSERNDSKKLSKTIETLLSLSSKLPPSFISKIKETKIRNDFKLLENLEKEKKSSTEMAKEYEKFFLKNKDHQLSDLASYNAAVQYEKSKKYIKALFFYKAFTQSQEKAQKNKTTQRQRRFYKNLVKNSLQSQALINEKIGLYKQAADAFTTYGTAYKNDPKSSDFVFRAALIYDGLLRYNQALKNYHLYLNLSSNKRKLEAWYHIGKIWEKRSNHWKALISYDRYIKSGLPKKSHLIEITFLLGKISEKLKRYNRAKVWHRKSLSLFRSLTESEKNQAFNYAAESQFYFAKNIYKKWLKIKVQGSQISQQKSVQRKIQLIEVLKKELDTVISYGDSDLIVASLAMQGEAFHHMFEVISNSPLPKGLTESEKELYQKEIQKISDDFLNQANESYKLAFKKASDFNVYGEWRNKALSYMRAKDPLFSYEDKEELFFKDPLTKLNFMKKYKNKKLFTKEEKFTLIDFVKNEIEESAGSEENKWLNKMATLLARDPNNIFALNLLGIFHLLKNESGLAQIVFNRALQQNENHPVIHNNFAALFAHNKDFKKARIFFSERRPASKEPLQDEAINESSLK